jgi:peroxiredoxin Q/BCP
MAQTETTIPPVGSQAPDFTLPTGDGSTIHLADLRGQTVLLYFYPKDDTPGCTTEACSFRDNWAELQRHGVVVLGVSRDDVKAHQKFAKKYSLPFPLLADLGGEVAQKYGVWVEKSMYGKTYMGIARSTFVVGSDGIVGAVYFNVKPQGHAEYVRDALEAGQS